MTVERHSLRSPSSDQTARTSQANDQANDCVGPRSWCWALLAAGGGYFFNIVFLKFSRPKRLKILDSCALGYNNRSFRRYKMFRVLRNKKKRVYVIYRLSSHASQHGADGELPGGGAQIYSNHFANGCSTFLNKLRADVCSPQVHI